jgi:hypothetical protein
MTKTTQEQRAHDRRVIEAREHFSWICLPCRRVLDLLDDADSMGEIDRGAEAVERELSRRFPDGLKAARSEQLKALEAAERERDEALAEVAAYKAFAEAAEIADSITYFVESKECLSSALRDLRAELERLKS